MEIISGQDKVRYHAAAAMVSNLYVGLANLCEEMLRNCGFSAANAHRALSPLMMGNTENIVQYRPVGALTGPIERNDLSTGYGSSGQLIRRGTENLSGSFCGSAESCQRETSGAGLF